MRELAMLAMLTAGMWGGTVIDRIAVVVGRHPIKASEINQDVRVTEFLNHEPLDESAAARKKSAERLIDQQLIRQELASGGYGRASDTDAANLLQQVRSGTYGNSESRFNAALRTYGLTEAEVRAHLLWQMTVLRFIDQRFRAGVLVTDEEVKTYYEQHRAAYRGDLAASSVSIRATLEGEQVNRQFEEWLKETRQQAEVRYHEEAFR